MAIQRVRSKLAKTDVLLRNAGLAPYIPETVPFQKDTLARMLTVHGMVYIKPDLGTFGNGVIRVETIEDAPLAGYRCYHGTQLHEFPTLEALYDSILGLKKKGRYVIQRGIELLRHQDRRFDVRIMVQHSPSGRWETTGMIGRLAHPKRVVTNYHSGGTLMRVSSLIDDHLTIDQQHAYFRQLAALGPLVAAQLATAYPRIREIGIDVAIDQTLQPWILEVNTLPDPYIFKKLETKAVFRKIYRYAQAYGRFSTKKRVVRTKSSRSKTSGKRQKSRPATP